MFNVSLVGRLTKNPTTKSVGEYELAAFTIAVKGRKDAVSFVDCEVWGKLGQSVMNYYQKGFLISCCGTGQYRKFETKTGEERNAFRIEIKECSILAKPEGNKTQQQNTNLTADIPF